MEIEIRDEIKDGYILHLGDIVRDNSGDFYVIMPTLDENNDRVFIARNMNYQTGLCGQCKSLEELSKKVNERRYPIYPKSEYKLVLERK